MKDSREPQPSVREKDTLVENLVQPLTAISPRATLWGILL